MKLWDLIVWNQRYKWKIIEDFMSSKKLIFFLYRLYKISAEGYKNANVEFLTIKTISEIWVSMKDVGSGIGIKNKCDLVLKEIYGICETNNLWKEQVNEYKMTKRQIYKKFTNLSQEELNAKNNKKTYVKNDVMTTVIKWCRGEKNKRYKSNWWI